METAKMFQLVKTVADYSLFDPSTRKLLAWKTGVQYATNVKSKPFPSNGNGGVYKNKVKFNVYFVTLIVPIKSIPKCKLVILG